jgi:hypothetical protein
VLSRGTIGGRSSPGGLGLTLGLAAGLGWLNQLKNCASATGAKAMHVQLMHNAQNESLRKRQLSRPMETE